MRYHLKKFVLDILKLRGDVIEQFYDSLRIIH